MNQVMIANRHIRVLLKFFSIGVIATLVHSGTFSLCIALQLMSAQWANLVAYLVALTVSYFGQRYWTFSSSEPNKQTNTLVRFIGVSLLGYCLNAFWVYTVTSLLSFSAYYALLGIGFLTPALTFVLLKYWVFTR
ncbi:MAG: GtrA family protein [Paraglaciecola sp.]|uniref:GtrA family protein n=1 Tax=Paraglaciecola sp. TaxID=1920173 RepID=UPI0032984680